MDLLAQSMAKVKEARAILAAAGDDGLSEDDAKRVETLTAEADTLEAQHKKIEAEALAGRNLDARIAAAAKPQPRKIIDPGNTAQVIDGPVAGFNNHQQFLAAVMEVGDRPGAKMDPRLVPLAAVGTDEQSTFSDPYGGFLVPEVTQTAPLMMEVDPDPVGGMTQKVPMGAPVINIPARVDKDHSTSVSGGLRVYRRAEADTSDASRMKFERIRMEATMLFGVSYTTEELLEDSPESITALLATGFADEFAAVKMEERLNGLGGGEFVGVNNATGLISITKEVGQVADTIVYENIIKAFARAWRPQMWLANKTCIPQLALLNVSVGTGGVPIWMPSAQPGLPGILLGLPIFYDERMATLGDAGDLMLCNWSQYLEGNYGASGSAESIHVRFVNHERCFKFFQRNAGAPWWSSELTPKRGDSQFPWVRIAERA